MTMKKNEIKAGVDVEQFIDIVQKFYNLIMQEQRELPVILHEVKDLQLVIAVNHQLNLAKNQVHHTEVILQEMGITLHDYGEDVEVFKQKISELITTYTDHKRQDLFIIHLIQKINRQKTVYLNLLMDYADSLETTTLKDFLNNTRKEEKATSRTLAKLAQLLRRRGDK
ncbi:DUF892 family protein [Fulvivirga sp. 29W222]|uniref:DUF892 family protein n=1 Tax=Fulvivirga marina TaxID=2494733 RepID=A0A937KCM2_9BACT|nr:DUF892 family protein [Fulvivirga marina]MBL6447677.1 DUF892 family protein [Fulvivirga marina]